MDLICYDKNRDINVVIVPSVFDLGKSVQDTLQHSDANFLADYLVDLPFPESWAVSVDGVIVEQSDWAKFYVKPAAQITLVRKLHGGESGSRSATKSILTSVAMMAVAHFSPILLAKMIPTLGQKTLGFNLLNGLLVMAGGGLVSFLMPPPDLQQEEEKTHYQFNDPIMSEGEGGTLPIIYGEFTTAGTLISSEKNSNYQDKITEIRRLYLLCEGEIEGVEWVKINDQFLTDYTDVDQYLSTGDPNNYTLDSQLLDNSRRYYESNKTLNFIEFKEQDKKDDETQLEFLNRIEPSYFETDLEPDINQVSFTLTFIDGLSGFNSRSANGALIGTWRAQFGMDVWVGNREDGELSLVKVDANDRILPWGDYTTRTNQHTHFQSYFLLSGYVEAYFRIERQRSYSEDEDAPNYEVVYERTFSGDYDTPERFRIEKTFQEDFNDEYGNSSDKYHSYRYRYFLQSSPTDTTPPIGLTMIDPVLTETRTPQSSQIGNHYSEREFTDDQLREKFSHFYIGNYIEKNGQIGFSIPINVTDNKTPFIRIRIYDHPDKFLRPEHELTNVMVSDVFSHKNTGVYHKNTAMAALAIRATKLLNSSRGIEKILFKVKGRKVNIYNRYGNVTQSDVWSNNPAWVLMDILRQWLRVPKDMIDFNSFFEWSEFCNDNALTFNGVFDRSEDAWTSIQATLRTGLATFNPLGAKLTVICHQKRPVTMIFNSNNIIKDSFEMSWSSASDRANVFEVEYFDKNINNRRQRAKITTDGAYQDDNIKPISLSLIGVDNKEQALKILGVYKKMNEVLLSSVQFEAYVDSIACTIGDRVRVMNDRVNWGRSFRLPTAAAAATNKIVTPLTESDLETYGKHFICQYDSKPIDTDCQIERIAPHLDKIRIKTKVDPDLVHYAKAIDSEGKTHILRLNYGYAPDADHVDCVLSNEMVELDTSLLWEIGQTHFAFSSEIIFVDAATGEITLKEALPMDLPAQANCAIGKVETVGKDFLISQILSNGDNRRQISAIEYNESLFDLTTSDGVINPSVNLPVPLGLVRNLKATEFLYKQDFTHFTRLDVTWSVPTEGNYRNAHVKIVTEDGRILFDEESVEGLNGISINALQNGEKLTIQCYAIDSYGTVSRDHAVLDHEIYGTLAAPQTPQDFAAELVTQGIKLTWSSSIETDVIGYQIRKGSSWDLGEIVIDKILATEFIAPRTTATSHNFMIKAMDVNETLSETEALITVATPVPDPIADLSMRQNGGLFYLKWTAHADPFVTSYVIYKALSDFSSKTFIAETKNTQMVISSDEVENNGYYFVKAKNRFGVLSDIPVRVLAHKTQSQNFNVVKTVDFSTWSGRKIGASVVNGNLEIDANVDFAEYEHSFALTGTDSVRLTIEQETSAQGSGLVTWSDMDTTTWDEAKLLTWQSVLLAEGHKITPMISTKRDSISSNLIEMYEFDNTDAIVKGKVSQSEVVDPPTWGNRKNVRGGYGRWALFEKPATFALGSPSERTETIVALTSTVNFNLVFSVGSKTVLIDVEVDGTNEKFDFKYEGKTVFSVDMANIKTSYRLVNNCLNIMLKMETASEMTLVAAIQGSQEAQIATLHLEGNSNLYVNSVSIDTEGNSNSLVLRHIRQQSYRYMQGGSSYAAYLKNLSQKADYTDYQRFISGMYQPSNCSLRYEFVMPTFDTRPILEKAKIIADVEDVEESGNLELDGSYISAFTEVITLSRNFQTKPSLIYQYHGGAEGVTATIKTVSLTKNSFSLEITLNNTDGTRSGYISWNCKGY